MKAHIQNVLRVAALSLAAVLGSFSTSQAAIVRGNFDPAFGYPFDGTVVAGAELGWEGTIQFYIPDACLTNNGIVDYTSCVGTGAEAGKKMEILSASVGLYDVNRTSPLDVKATLDFSPTSTSPWSFILNQVEFHGGNLSGIATTYSAPKTTTSTFAGINDYYFALGFGLDTGPVLVALEKDLLLLDISLFRRSLQVDVEDYVSYVSGLKTIPWWAKPFFPIAYDYVIDKAGSVDTGGGDGISKFSASFDLNFVPEPESLLLMLVALAALGATTRRRSNTAAYKIQTTHSGNQTIPIQFR